MRKQTIFYIALIIVVIVLIWLIANLDALFPAPKDAILSNLTNLTLPK